MAGTRLKGRAAARFTTLALTGVALLTGACDNAAEPTLASPAEAALAAGATPEQAQAQAEQFAKTLALALNQPGMRGVLHAAMKESRYNEHKLVLQDFATTPAGARMVRAMAAAASVDEPVVRGWIAALPAMDFYVPFGEHRRSWTGSNGSVVVASNIRVDETRFTGYAPDGSSKRYDSRDGTPGETVIFLHPAEPKVVYAASRAPESYATLEDPSAPSSSVTTIDPSGIEPDMNTSPVATYSGQLHAFKNYVGDGVGGVELTVKHYAGRGGTRIDQQVVEESDYLTWDGYFYDEVTYPNRTMQFAQYGETWIKVWERDSGAESWNGDGDDFWGEGAFGGFNIKHRFSVNEGVALLSHSGQNCFVYNQYNCPPATVDIVYRPVSSTPTNAGAFGTGDLSLFTFYNTAGAWSINNGHLVANRNAQQSLAVRNGVTMGDGWAETETSRSGDGGLVLRVQNASNYYSLAVRDDSYYPHANIEIYRVQNGVHTRLGSRLDISFPAGVKKKVRFEAIGTTLRAYVDGAVVLTVTDGTFTAGGLGMRANNSTGTDLQAWFSVFRYNAVNPADPFTAADALSGYTIFNTPEAWYVSGGWLNAGSGASQSIVARNGVNFADGWVETETDQAGDAGLVLRGQGPDSYYSTAIRDDAYYGYANFEIYKVVNGTHTPLTSQIDVSFPRGTRKTVRFEAVGTTLKVYVNGTVVAQATDATYASGFVGLRANNSTGGPLTSRFDVFRFNQY